jgi:hypothetical protein
VTFLLYTGFGASLSGFLLHLVLALGRRVDRQRIVFALLLADLCAYFLYEHQLYNATTVEEVVRVTRAEMPFTVAYFLLFGWFILHYTRLRMPRPIIWLYCGGLAAALVYNYTAPYGFYYSVRPRIVTASSFGGETIHIAQAPLALAAALYYLLATAMHVTGIVGGIRMARHGERLRGIIFAFAVGLPLLALLLDVVHELIGASWPYLAEFGLVGLSVILSVQLAIDFRVQEATLADALARETRALERVARVALAVKDMANTPLPGARDLSGQPGGESVAAGLDRAHATRGHPAERARSGHDCLQRQHAVPTRGPVVRSGRGDRQRRPPRRRRLAL